MKKPNQFQSKFQKLLLKKLKLAEMTPALVEAVKNINAAAEHE